MAAKKKFDLFLWLRSTLRSASRRYPPIYEALAAAKEPYNNPANPRQKVAYRCAECKGLFGAKEVAVDHIEPAGRLIDWEDVQGFTQRLFCQADGLQVLCKSCHDVKSYMEKNNVSKEEAIIRKEIIRVMKVFTKVSLMKKLMEHGYEASALSNEDKRKKAVETLIRKGIKFD